MASARPGRGGASGAQRVYRNAVRLYFRFHARWAPGKGLTPGSRLLAPREFPLGVPPRRPKLLLGRGNYWRPPLISLLRTYVRGLWVFRERQALGGVIRP